MLQTSEVGQFLSSRGFDFYSGVPCSFLKDLINYAINEEDYVMAANEGDAVAIASGAYLGGRKSVFLCQNSGLANAVSPLTSLTYTFKIPLLGFVSLRGEPGLQDEPQHELMGQITSELLTTMRIRHAVLSQHSEKALEQLQEADAWIEKGESYFFIVQKGTFEKVALLPQKVSSQVKTTIVSGSPAEVRPTRYEVLNEIVQTIQVEDAIVLATTGLTGRELFEIADRDNQLYMVGSMGAVSSIGLGLAIARPDKKVIAIDGDGALLMRMGAMSTVGYYKPKNLYHLLLDNGAHESTGGQFTASPIVNFPKIAEATNYERVETVEDVETLSTSLNHWLTKGGLTFTYVPTKTGVKPNLGRPDVTPEQVKSRLINYMNRGRI